MKIFKKFFVLLMVSLLVGSFGFLTSTFAGEDEEILAISDVLVQALPEVFDGDKGFAAVSTFGMPLPTAGEGVFTRVSDFQRDVLFNQAPAPVVDGSGGGSPPSIVPSKGKGVTPFALSNVLRRSGNSVNVPRQSRRPN